MICNIKNFDERLKLIVVFQLIKNINDCFDFDEIFKLFDHEKNDYAINLIFDVVFSFDFLYAFSKKEFRVLQNYIHENLALKKIKYFINEIEIFVMFVFKKNENFRLCVDYRDLNVITIKNRYFFFSLMKR